MSKSTTNLVWCPMCQDWHENNTQCQRNDQRSDPMLEMPTPFYDKDILDAVGALDSKDFDSLDDSDKDHLVSLAISALDNDIDVVLSMDANLALVKYLKSYDPDDRIELHHAVIESAREQFSPYFNQLFSDVEDEKEAESFKTAGKTAQIDVNNGETYYV